MSINKIENNVESLLELENKDLTKTCNDIDALRNGKILDKKIVYILNDLIEELRIYYIENNSEMYKFKENFYPEVIKKLSEVVKDILWVYDAFAIVRNWDLQKSMKLLDEVFENCILRRDLDYMNEIIVEEEYECDKSEFRKFINAFREAAYDCVSKLLSEKSIKKSFELNTGIDPILANSISQNINSHFMELKDNYIIDNLPDF